MIILNKLILMQLDKMKDKPYIVNLAHGIHKTTPVTNVRKFIETVKHYRDNV